MRVKFNCKITIIVTVVVSKVIYVLEKIQLHGPGAVKDKLAYHGQDTFKKKNVFLFCLHICAPHGCLVLVEATKGHRIPWV